MTPEPSHFAALQSNPFFSGGLLLGLLAALAAYGRRALIAAAGALRRRFVSELEVRGYETVIWLGIWIAHTPYGKRCRRLKTFTWGGSVTEGDASVFFEPGYGYHLFRHGGRWIVAERRREDKDSKVLLSQVQDHFVLYVLGPRSAVLGLVDEAKEFSREALSRRTAAYLSDGKGSWERLTVGAPRSLESIVLDDGVAEDLAADARTFLARRSWYAERGIPWRRGYLFEGPPGTGKTSLIRALSHELGLPLYVLDLTADQFSDRALVLMLSFIPIGAMVLLEDLDVQLGARASSLTLSGLLNAVDGPLATEGRLLFVTTNEPQRLDAAVDRPGRVDRRVHFGLASRSQARRIFLRFFPGREELADDFSVSLPDRAISPAAIQGHLVRYSESAEAAAGSAAELCQARVRIVARGVGAH